MTWTYNGWEEPVVGVQWGEYTPSGHLRMHRVMDVRLPPVASREQPVHRPHYSDERFARGREHTLFGATEKGLSYEYSDRLRQWDWNRMERSSNSGRMGDEHRDADVGDLLQVWPSHAQALADGLPLS